MKTGAGSVIKSMKTGTQILSLVLLAAVAPLPVVSQPIERGFRAVITGGPVSEGKCTIEVVVDNVAVVEVSGDRGRLVTLSGQPAEWRRMICTAPLPPDPVEFRFKGIDGRGRVFLDRDPRANRGTAVIRIEDPKSGREGYTFDLLWRGAYVPPPPPPPVYSDRDDRYRDRDRGERRRDVQVIACDSVEGRRTFCEANTRNGVVLLRQRGERECREGQNWGYDRRGIWVDRGCRADFEVAR